MQETDLETTPSAIHIDRYPIGQIGFKIYFELGVNLSEGLNEKRGTLCPRQQRKNILDGSLSYLTFITDQKARRS